MTLDRFKKSVRDRVHGESRLGFIGRFQLPIKLFPLLIFLNLVSMVLEGLGIGLLLPVFEVLQRGGSVDPEALTGAHWDILRDVSAAIGVPLTLGSLLAASFTLLLVRQVMTYITAVIHGIAKRRSADRVRRVAFNAFLRADTAIQDRVRVGELANELTVELERAMSSIFSAVRSVGSVVQASIYVVGLMVLSPMMTLMSIASMVVLVLVMRGPLKRVKGTGAEITEANVALGGFMIERLQRARLIRLSGTERAESKAFGKLSSRQVEGEVRHKLLTTRLGLIPEPVAIGLAYTAVFAGSQFFGLSLEVLGLFVVVLIRILPICLQILNDYNKIIGQWPAVQKIDRRLRAISRRREDKGGDTTFETLNKDIVYDAVSFEYRGVDTPVLNEVTVSVPAQRITALVGPSGAGKSTFVDLMPRLRTPSGGQILFDGVPISDFSTVSLRAGIAFVPQEPQIFNISAAEHIRYGKEDATDAEVREAARLAGALEFIEALPQGFETPLGDGGDRLSGGQRQRLDIARALVRRAPILILDEPTSALDADAEHAFRDALNSLRRETALTIIVIAHRLSTIADADNIIVLNCGQVEATGSHTQLVGRGGWYAKAFNLQKSSHDVGSARPVDSVA